MKIKSLLLAFLIFISVLSPTLYAKDYDNAMFLQAKSFLTQLGINSGINKTATEDITRAEFAAMMVRSINMREMGYAGTDYADCEGNPFINEIYAAKKLGITNGTSENTFSPNEGVSMQTAAKMAVTALGYKDYAEALGGYSAGYLHVTNSLGIFKGVKNSPSLSTADAYIFIRNMLLADKAIITGVSSGTLQYHTLNGRNILTEDFGYEKISGVITTAGYNAVNPLGAGKGKIGVLNKIFDTEIFAEEYLGLYADLWYSAEENKVYAVDALLRNTIYEIDAEDVTEYKMGNLHVETDDEKEKIYRVGSGVTFVENGRAISHNSSSFTPESGSFKLIDNNADGAIDYVILAKREYFVIRNINLSERKIYDECSTLKEITLSDNEDYDVIITIDGENATLEELSIGLTFEVFASRDKKILRLNGVSKKLKGEVNEINSDNTVIIEGTEYRKTKYFESLKKTLKPGTSYSFMLSPDKKIVDISAVSDEDLKYGIFMGYEGKKNISGSAKVKLCDDNGKIVVCDLHDKIYFNSSTKSDNSVLASLMNGEIPLYQLVKYKLIDKKIASVDTFSEDYDKWDVDTEKDSYNSLTRYIWNKNINAYQGTGTPHVSLSDAIMFRVPTDFDLNVESPVQKLYDDEAFGVMYVADLGTDNKEINVDVYDFDDFYVPSVVLVRSDGVNITWRSQAHVVRRVTENAIDSEGMPIVKIEAYGNKKYEEFILKPEVYLALGANKPSKFDVVRFNVDGEGYVNSINIDVKYNASSTGDRATVKYGSYVSSNIHASCTYIPGTVYKVREDRLVLKEKWSNKTGYWFSAPGNTISIPLKATEYVIIDKTRDEVKAGSVYDLVSESQAGATSASFAVCCTSTGVAKIVYIYVD